MGDQIQITTADGRFGAYRARPSQAPAPAVVVLHEVFGVNCDIRQTCDALAAQGFLAIAPDLFWRQQPGVDLDVRSEPDWQIGLALYQAYDRDIGVGDVAATLCAASRMDGASGKVGVVGYCLGGLMAFLVAARGQVDAAVAFHGADTEKYLDEASTMVAPMLIHLAGEDEFMPSAARAAIRSAMADKPNVQLFTYEGCNHAFSRHNGAHYDAKAAALANRRTWAFLDMALGGVRGSSSPS
ncbi:MAG TPA: dienelactone hydrolase family protein [Allosphingosinicella sp.]|jgi:carboxymethylenebutenolidase